MQARRYAVYFAPEAGSALARFGADWLGRDAETGAPRPEMAVPGLPLARAEITAKPRRYGFHGTLKPPFRLADGRSAAELDQALAGLAGEFAAFDLPPLRLEAVGDFLALVPERACGELAALAEAAILDLDGFRAPADAEERARRRAVGLTPGQEALLAQWGYPYVLDEFRFHLTLTGPLAPDLQARTRAALDPVLAPLTGAPVPFRDICLFGEDEDGLFRILRRHSLNRPVG